MKPKDDLTNRWNAPTPPLLSQEELEKFDSRAWDKLYPQQEPRTASRTFEGTAIIVTPLSGMSHNLNETATFLWENMRGDHTIGEITALLCAEFEVDDETAMNDVKAFVLEGVNKGFLRVARKKLPPLPFED